VLQRQPLVQRAQADDKLALDVQCHRLDHDCRVALQQAMGLPLSRLYAQRIGSLQHLLKPKRRQLA